MEVTSARVKKGKKTNIKKCIYISVNSSHPCIQLEVGRDLQWERSKGHVTGQTAGTKFADYPGTKLLANGVQTEVC